VSELPLELMAPWARHEENSVTTLDRSFVEWLVPARSTVQAKLLELHKVVADGKITPHIGDPAFVIADYMMAAGFSLWRAVFLAERGIDAEETVAEGLGVVWKVLMDNTITYRDDKNPWSFRYYVHNAGLRLGEILKRLSPEEREAIAEPLLPPEPGTPTSRTAWERAFNVFRLLIPILEQRLTKGV
jgi:hypothetical protein